MIYTVDFYRHESYFHCRLKKAIGNLFMKYLWAKPISLFSNLQEKPMCKCPQARPPITSTGHSYYQTVCLPWHVWAFCNCFVICKQLVQDFPDIQACPETLQEKPINSSILIPLSLSQWSPNCMAQWQQRRFPF